MSYMNLPVLDKLVKIFEDIQLPEIESIVFVCVQHFLFSSINLFESMIKLGVKPDNIFLLGKSYSYCKEVERRLLNLDIHVVSITKQEAIGDYARLCNADVARMWEEASTHIFQNKSIKGIIILDEGGHCFEFAPRKILDNFRVIGIEQTTGGIINPAVLNFSRSFVDVARSAVKKLIESKIIAEAIVEKALKILPKYGKNVRCGIIGSGVIGTALLIKLKTLGYSAFIYEPYHKHDTHLFSDRFSSAEELIQNTNYIFGCTGRDFLKDKNIDSLASAMNENKYFISCSSEDKEFLSFLKYFLNKGCVNFDPFTDVKYVLENKKTICIVNGGFPINFDCSGVSVPSIQIQLTRGLLLSAIVQSIFLLFDPQPDNNHRKMLSPALQKFVFMRWLECNKHFYLNQELVYELQNEDWIAKKSDGFLYVPSKLSNIFNMLDDAPPIFTPSSECV